MLRSFWKAALAQVDLSVPHPVCQPYVYSSPLLCRQLADIATVIGILDHVVDIAVGWNDAQGLSSLASTINNLSYPTMMAWSVCSLATNTVLSLSIIIKIMCAVDLQLP
jgi:hypothetical protein